MGWHQHQLRLLLEPRWRKRCSSVDVVWYTQAPDRFSCGEAWHAVYANEENLNKYKLLHYTGYIKYKSHNIHIYTDKYTEDYYLWRNWTEYYAWQRPLRKIDPEKCHHCHGEMGYCRRKCFEENENMRIAKEISVNRFQDVLGRWDYDLNNDIMNQRQSWR